MKSMFTSIFLLALLPSAFALPSNQLEARNTCPTCNPLPFQNKCHITTSCIPNAPGGGGDICACRAGYRAANNLHGTSVQWRLRWTGQEGRVFVAPGTVCNTLCDHWQLGKNGCAEVNLRQTCGS